MSQFVAGPTTFVSVGTASTVILTKNIGRREVSIVNDSANIIYLGFTLSEGTVPTAVLNKGVRLNANGGSWSSTEFEGAVSGISAVAASNVTVYEI